MRKINIKQYTANLSTYLRVCVCTHVHLHQIGEEWKVKLRRASGVREGLEEREGVTRMGGETELEIFPRQGNSV